MYAMRWSPITWARTCIACSRRRRETLWSLAPQHPSGNIHAMPSSDDAYSRLVEQQADEVITAWDKTYGTPLPADFNSLLDLACQYQALRRENGEREQLFPLSAEQVAKEVAAREAFCLARKGYLDKHPKLRRT